VVVVVVVVMRPFDVACRCVAHAAESSEHDSGKLAVACAR
jgi:hypothetical protein